MDIHTHYDAQLHFEPTASPSSWHGVTTVLTGNCGFTFAPARPADLDWLLQMLSRVEGMSAEALTQAVTFRGGSFADFLGGFDGRVGVNVAANVGHCALRRWVMGDDASERAATDAEVEEMAVLLRLALADGAVGFTSSQLDLHVAHDGRPVPSNLAEPGELIALAAVLGELDRGAIEFIPRTFLTGYDDDDRRLVRAMAVASRKAVHLNTVTQMPHAPDGWIRSLQFAEEAASEGLHLHPMFATNKRGTHFALGTTFLFDEMPTFRDTLTLPAGQRERELRDPAVRDRMRKELADPTGRSIVFGVAGARSRGHRDREPRRQGAREVAAHPPGRHDPGRAALRRPEQLRRRPDGREAGAEREVGRRVAEGPRRAGREASDALNPA